MLCLDRETADGGEGSGSNGTRKDTASVNGVHQRAAREQCHADKVPCLSCAAAGQPELGPQGEPSDAEQVRTIATGALASGALYGAVRLLFSSSHTEDVVDMLHSLYTSTVAMYGVLGMVRHPVHLRALPPRLSSGRGPVVRMFCHSLGYFLADVCKIAVDILLRGKFPHLWAGRLAHHAVQLCANWPGIFGRGDDEEASKKQSLAWRSILCRAYVAELSSIFLRLSNLLRQREHSPLAVLAVNWTLLATFFGSRLVNFAIAIAMFIRARPVVSPTIFKVGATVQTAGYLLSTVWFTKIVRITLNSRKTLVPSVEC